MRDRFLRAAPAAMALAVPAAYAHSGHAEGFAAAFAHPFGGIDHLLAMLLVGIWAAQLGRHRGAAALTLPLAFVLSATGGLLAGLLGLALPLTEQAVVTSLLVLGLLLALAAPLPLAAAAALCALFGFFHGLAHGAELHGSAWTTAAGMASATALLHAAGFAVARAAGAHSALLARLSGGAVGAVGLALALRMAV